MGASGFKQNAASPSPPPFPYALSRCTVLDTSRSCFHILEVFIRTIMLSRSVVASPNRSKFYHNRLLNNLYEYQIFKDQMHLVSSEVNLW
ncbi:hypothetical protein L1987_61239 [Smallanthus sonchifolius]|uniref:Uncharacterized protein n=1 Tax=Smallanthus sonchifolius TaxID=185202 RepID=A0ACB9DA69_9ASTR|nr:hypothetical protein L1987_61239 [Smallanthus sonchifolius]